MRVLAMAAIAGLIVLAGCDAAPEGAGAPAADVAERAPVAAKSGAPDKIEVGNGTRPVAAETPRPPQIAYVYAYGFRLPAAAIAPLEQRHADLCQRKGPNVCQIISMEQTGSEGQYVHGTLQLAVAANQARDFGRELADLAKDANGEEINSAISGEDLSKQIVDTEARLRARTLLRDRLMELLATRKGTVAELVEAERDVAQVNEEIDQATSWLAEMKGRVAYSHVNVSYESGSPIAGGFVDPIRSALGNIGSILGLMVAALIMLLTIGLPIIVVVVFVRAVWPRMRPFLRAREVATPEKESPD